MNRCLILVASLSLVTCGAPPAPQDAVAKVPPVTPSVAAPDVVEPVAKPRPQVEPLESARAILAAAGFVGTFVVRRTGDPSLYASNPALAAKRYLPASTFKIPNALFALETGVAPDETFALPWDGQRRHFKSWDRDHDLRSAMQHSVVWYFQEIARRMGLERMAKLVRDVGYGNEHIGEKVDLFWLEGPLAISPEEQVRFIERLVTDDLPVAPRHGATVRRILTERQVGSDSLHAKTGTAIRIEHGHAWLVGFTKRGGAVTSCFALLLLGEPEQGVKRLVAERWDLAIRLLQAADIIGPGTAAAEST